MNLMDNGQQYFTAGQVANMLNISRQAVDNAVKRKRIPCMTTGINNMRLFTIDAIEAYRRDFARKADKR